MQATAGNLILTKPTPPGILTAHLEDDEKRMILKMVMTQARLLCEASLCQELHRAGLLGGKDLSRQVDLTQMEIWFFSKNVHNQGGTNQPTNVLHKRGENPVSTRMEGE